MKIRGVTFNPIWAMSGLLNFFKEGYWYHQILKARGVSFAPLTFVAKTTTLLAREGNMPLNRKFQPKEWLPRCIYVDPVRLLMLNAVGLSGPGLMALLSQNIWQKIRQPFFISFMSTAQTRQERFDELERFGWALWIRRSQFGQFGVQLNVTCPNTGHELAELADEVGEMLEILGNGLGNRGDVPMVPKLSLEIPPIQALKISQHRYCDALHFSNSIPVGKLPDLIPWQKLLPKGSPLERRGFTPGGLSGKPLQPLVVEYAKELKRLGVAKPRNAGGGIYKPQHVNELFEAGVDSVSIGSAAVLAVVRPDQVNLKAIIDRAYE